MAASEYLALPSSITNRTKELAKAIIGNETTPHKKAVLLANYIMANYNISSSEQELLEGNDTVDYFLFNKTNGTYLEFGLAFLVLSRLNNIPTRYALGYKIGNELLNGTYEVHASDTTCWGEVLFNDMGWVQYDLIPSNLPTRINITSRPDSIYNGVPFVVNASAEFFANGVWTPIGNGTRINVTLNNTDIGYPVLNTAFEVANRGTTNATGVMSETFLAPGLLPGGYVDVVAHVMGTAKYMDSWSTPRWNITNETERNATNQTIYYRTTLLEITTLDSVRNGTEMNIYGTLVADQGNNITEFDTDAWKMNKDLWLDNKSAQILWNGQLVGNITTTGELYFFDSNGNFHSFDPKTKELYFIDLSTGNIYQVTNPPAYNRILSSQPRVYNFFVSVIIDDRAGAYNLTVRFAGDTYNKSSSTSKMINVLHPVQIDVQIDPESVIAGETIRVSGSIMKDDDGSPVNLIELSQPTGGATFYNKTSGMWTNYTTNSGLLENYVNAIAPDGEWIWFGTTNGVSKYNKTSFEIINYTAPTDLPSNTVYSIAVDGNTTWVGTYNGIARYTKGTDANRSWERWDIPSWTAGNIVSSILVDGSTVWFGTNRGVIEYNKTLDDGNYTQTTIDDGSLEYCLRDRRISSMAADDWNIWFGTDVGLSQYNKTTGAMTNYTALSGLPSPQVSAIAIDGANVWVGTIQYWNGTSYSGGGVSVYNKVTSTWNIFNTSTSSGLISNNITCIAVDGSSIWFGTHQGVNRYDKNTLQFYPYTVQSGLASNETLTIVKESNGLWFGTRFKGGLAQNEIMVEYHIDNTTQAKGAQETHITNRAKIVQNKFSFEYKVSNSTPPGDYSVIVVFPEAGYYLKTAYQWIIKVRQKTEITITPTEAKFRGDTIELKGKITAMGTPMQTTIGRTTYKPSDISIEKSYVLNPPAKSKYKYAVTCTWNDDMGDITSTDIVGSNFTLTLQVPFNQSIGIFTAKVQFDDTYYYTNSSATFDYTIMTRTKIEMDSKFVHRGTNITIRGSLYEKNSTTAYVDTSINKSLAGKEIHIYWNSSSSPIGNGTTDANGTYTINYSVGTSQPLGKVNVSSKFDTADFYNSSSAQVYYYVISNTTIFDMHIIPQSKDIANEVIKGTNVTILGQLLDDWNRTLEGGVIRLYWEGKPLADLRTNSTGYFNYTLEAYNIAGSNVLRGINTITANFIGMYVYEYRNNLTNESAYLLTNTTDGGNYTFVREKIQNYMDINETTYVPYVPCSGDIVANVTSRTEILVQDMDAAIRNDDFVVSGSLYEHYGSQYGRGNSVPNQDILITFTNRTYTVKTDDRGRFILSIHVANNTPIGESNKINIAFNGNYKEHLKPSSASSNITITSHTVLTVECPREIVYGDRFTISVKLTYKDDGALIKNETIYMMLSNGKDVWIIQNITTDNMGKAYYNGSVSSDVERPFTVYFSFAGNESSYAEAKLENKSIRYTIPLWIKISKNALAILGSTALIFVPLGFAVAYITHKRRQEIEGLKYIIKRTTKQLIAGNEYVATIFKLYRRLSHHLKKFGHLRKEGETFREFEVALRNAIPYIDARQFSFFISILEEARYSSHRITPQHQNKAINCLNAIEASLSRYEKLDKIEDIRDDVEIVTRVVEKKPTPTAKIFTVKKMEPVAGISETEGKKVRRKAKEKGETFIVRAKPSDIKPIVTLKPVMTLKPKEKGEEVQEGEATTVKSKEKELMQIRTAKEAKGGKETDEIEKLEKKEGTEKKEDKETEKEGEKEKIEKENKDWTTPMLKVEETLKESRKLKKKKEKVF
jgi:hypothetical protein